VMLSDMASNITQVSDHVSQKKCIVVLLSGQRYRFFVQIPCFAISARVSRSLGGSSQRANQIKDVVLLARQHDRLRPFTGSIGRFAFPPMLRCTGDQFLGYVIHDSWRSRDCIPSSILYPFPMRTPNCCEQRFHSKPPLEGFECNCDVTPTTISKELPFVIVGSVLKDRNSSVRTADIRTCPSHPILTPTIH
jgi:hypothetical protein